MDKALAMVEYSTVSSGMRSLDLMSKTAEIEILEAQTVCPGKFMILFCGDLSSVKASLEATEKAYPENEIDSFILGNPAQMLIPALNGVVDCLERGAIGIVETYSGASAIVAADTAAKTAAVTVIEIRLSRGMCGKSYAMFMGEIAAVEASLEASKKVLADSGMLLDTVLIANPNEKMRSVL